jgi:hypothetical protein
MLRYNITNIKTARFCTNTHIFFIYVHYVFFIRFLCSCIFTPRCVFINDVINDICNLIKSEHWKKEPMLFFIIYSIKIPKM